MTTQSNFGASTPAQNGMGVNGANGQIELGGDLIRPTVINTSAANTLSLTGLTVGDAATDVLAVIDPAGQIKFIPVTGLPDFWRAIATGNYPDGVTDINDPIRHLGSIGVGGSLATDPLPTVTTPQATNSYLQLSNNAAGRGQLMYGSNPALYYMERTVPVALNNYVEIGSWTSRAQASVFSLTVNVSDGAFATSKYYVAALGYNATANTWRVLKPLADGGIFNGNNFELLINVNNNVVSLRLRRTAGATAGTFRIYLSLKNDPSTVLTESILTANDAGVYTQLDPFGGSQNWTLLGNTGTVNTPYNDGGAQASNFAGTLDNIAWSAYTNAGHANAKSDIKLYTATPSAAAITPPVDIFHIRRNGQVGVIWPQVLSVALGHWYTDTNSRTRVDFKLGNGGVNVPDFTNLSLFSQGGVGINGNGGAADWAWTNTGGGIGRGQNGGALLALMGANGSNNVGPHVGIWTAADTFPLFYQLNWTHDNVSFNFDGYFDGAWKAAHTSRPYSIYKQVDRLNFYGQAAAPVAAGSAWTLDLMMAMRYAGATLAGGELWFNNVGKNRRIVLWDANAASDHQFYGLGINTSMFRAQVDSVTSNFGWYAATGAAASNELMRLTGAGRLGIGTNAPTALLHVSGPNANGAATPLLRLSDTNLAGSYFAVDNGAAANAYRAIATTNFELQSGANSNQLYLSTNGSVGIGTNAPTAGIGNLSVNTNGFKPGGGAWGAFSDRRIKKNIEDFSPGLKEVLLLKPITFQYNGKGGIPDNGKTYTSLIAQDVQDILPDFVEAIASDDMDDGKLLVLKEGLTNFEALLINAVKELAKRVEALENRK